MIIILGLDGLDYGCVNNFNCRNLMQCSYGRTDLSVYRELKTVALWSSFLAEKNIEEEVSKDSMIWSFRLPVEMTFFSKVKTWQAFDVPGFTYEQPIHQEERDKLKDFFDKKCAIEDYDRIVFEHYRRSKEIFLNNLQKSCDIQMGYFSLADAIGHLSFGVTSKMRIVYEELDTLAYEVCRHKKTGMMILSDHGMEPVGRFGDHSHYGFWSFAHRISPDKDTLLRLEQLYAVFRDTINI